MNAYGFIDPNLVSETQMTPDEAQAVIELWAERQRAGSGATVADLAEGLAIPPREVREYLAQVRAATSTPFKPARSKRTDIRLAVFATCLAIVGVIGLASFFSFRSRRISYAPYGERRVFVEQARTPVATADVGTGTAVPTMSYSSSVPNSQWARYATAKPDRFGYRVGERAVSLPTGTDLEGSLAQLRDSLTKAIGGPLAANSIVSSDPLKPDEIVRAIRGGPEDVESLSPPAESYNPAPPLPRPTGREVLEWRSVAVGYGGKSVEATFPYARVSDKGLREAVQKEHARLLSEMLDSVREIARAKTGAK